MSNLADPLSAMVKGIPFDIALCGISTSVRNVIGAVVAQLPGLQCSKEKLPHIPDIDA